MSGKDKKIDSENGEDEGDLPNEGDEQEPEIPEEKKSRRSSSHVPHYVLFAGVFLLVGIFVGPVITGNVTGNAAFPGDIGVQAAAEKLMNYVNMFSSVQDSKFVGEGNSTNIFYEINLDVTTADGTQTVPIYISRDGKYLLGVSDIDAMMAQFQAQNAASQTETGVPKSDKPVVELFVMSFCPYGVQAENAMAPVVGLLGDKADIKIRFIASVSGDSLDSVSSLHGVLEGKEDARQLCVAKNYDTTTYWAYLTEINNNCYPIYSSGEDAYNTCWKAAAATAGIDTNVIETCMADEGVALINAERAAASSYGVTGSPTLIINGVRYSGSRTAEAFKAAICNAFNTPPEECSQELSSEGGTVSGGC